MGSGPPPFCRKIGPPGPRIRLAPLSTWISLSCLAWCCCCLAWCALPGAALPGAALPLSASATPSSRAAGAAAVRSLLGQRPAVRILRPPRGGGLQIRSGGAPRPLGFSAGIACPVGGPAHGHQEELPQSSQRRGRRRKRRGRRWRRLVFPHSSCGPSALSTNATAIPCVGSRARKRFSRSPLV